MSCAYCTGGHDVDDMSTSEMIQVAHKTQARSVASVSRMKAQVRAVALHQHPTLDSVCRVVAPGALQAMAFKC